MENDIICVTEHIEIHPSRNGGHYSVVLDGQVYGTYASVDYAQQVADELAEDEQ